MKIKGLLIMNKQNTMNNKMRNGIMLKIKKGNAILKFMLITLLTMSGNVFAGTYSGGSGTSGDPYQISTTADLIELSTTSGDWSSKYFIQTADIAFNADETQVDWDGDGSATWDTEDQKGFSPIGNNNNPAYFTGNYDGDGHTIDNLHINRSTDFIGLFGWINSGAQISNLGVTNVDITGYDYVGGLVGRNNNQSTVSNSYSTGSVNGGDYVGGLVGMNILSSTVSNSYSTGSVRSVSGDKVGGLVGWNDNSSTVSNSYSTGSVSGDDLVGGLVGYNSLSSTVSNSYSTGNVNDSDDYVGGLVGYNSHSSTVSNSYFTGSVSSSHSNYVGGLVGYNNNQSTVSNSYSTGSVTSRRFVGGLVGYNYTNSTVSNSYSTGSVTRGSGSNTSLGGFCGYNNATIEYCYSTGSVFQNDGVTALGTANGFVSNNASVDYTSNFWDSEASNQSAGIGATGKTTAQMKTLATFTDASWDFSSTPIWDRADNQNGGYPHLHWQTFPRTVTFTNGSSFSPSPTQGATDQAIGRFALRGDANGATFDGVWITLNGTRTGATNFKLWYSTDATYGSDTQFGSTVAADPGTGEKIWFTSLSNSIGTSDGYYFLSCDVAADATGSIRGVIVDDEDMMLGFSTSTTSSANLSGSDVSLPVELTSFTADNSRAGEITLNWITESEIENLGFILERRQVAGGGSHAEWTEIASYITDEALRGQGSVTYQTVYTYTDKSVEPGVTYDYRLADVSYAGEKVYHALNVLGIEVTELPEQFALFPAYPNPFNPATTISYNLIEDGNVTLTIFDINGREVSRLVEETQTAGEYELFWDANHVSSGVYFCRLVQGNHVSTQKLILLK